jgi:hypothetical protein
MERTIVILIGVLIVAGALNLAVPQYQIVMGENQAIARRVNTQAEKLAVCMSPDLPAAGCTSSGIEDGLSAELPFKARTVVDFDVWERRAGGIGSALQ